MKKKKKSLDGLSTDQIFDKICSIAGSKDQAVNTFIDYVLSEPLQDRPEFWSHILGTGHYFEKEIKDVRRTAKLLTVIADKNTTLDQKRRSFCLLVCGNPEALHNFPIPTRDRAKLTFTIIIAALANNENQTCGEALDYVYEQANDIFLPLLQEVYDNMSRLGKYVEGGEDVVWQRLSEAVKGKEYQSLVFGSEDSVIH